MQSKLLVIATAISYRKRRSNREYKANGPLLTGIVKGALEDVRIYNRALTENEVLAIYTGEGLDGVANGMVIWYPMKDRNAELVMEGDVGVIQDRSGAGNHGNVKGNPVWKTCNNDAAAQKRREQIGATREWMRRETAEWRSFAKWFEKQPEGAKKWRGRFEELNKRFTLTTTNEIY